MRKAVTALLLLLAVSCGSGGGSNGGDSPEPGDWFDLQGIVVFRMSVRNTTDLTITSIVVRDFEKPFNPWYRLKVEIRPGQTWIGPLVPFQYIRVGFVTDYMDISRMITFTDQEVRQGGFDLLFNPSWIWIWSPPPLDIWASTRSLFSEVEWLLMTKE